MSETKERIPSRFSRFRLARGNFRLSMPGIPREPLAKIWRWLVRAATVVLMILVSLYTAAIVLNGHPGTFAAAWAIFFIFSAISVLVHELGHAAAARAVGWRVNLIVVGRWAFAPRRGRFIRIRDRGYRQDLGGWVNATPPPGVAWRDGSIPFILGGPIGNLVLAVAAALAALAVHGTDRHVFAGLLGLAAISTVFAVANLVPLRGPGSRRNDGALLIDAYKGDEPPLRDQRIARLVGRLFDGLPVAQWDESAVNELTDDPSMSRDDVDSLLINYALAVADVAALKVILERYLEAKPGSNLEYRCLYAFAIAMIDGDGPRAAKILEKVPGKAAKKSFSFWRAQATTSHLLGSREEALAAIRNARHAVGKLGARPDDDDEAVFRAITLGEELPRLEPRGRLSVGGKVLGDPGDGTGDPGGDQGC